MDKTISLFKSKKADNVNLHPTYERISKEDCLIANKQRAYFENAYKAVHPYLDKTFLTSFPTRKHFIHRLWELNLAYTLKNQKNLELIAPKPKSYPDFHLKATNLPCEFYIETIVLTPGNNSPALSAPYSPGEAKDMRANRIELDLRITSALRDKKDQYIGNSKRKGWLGHNTINSNFPYIIAINFSGIPFYNDPLNPNDWLRNLFGLGEPTILYDKNSMCAITPWHFTSRPNLLKSSTNTNIETNCFLLDEFKVVSAVMFSHFALPYLSCEQPVENKPWLVHNPNAINPLPYGLFSNLNKEI